MKSFRGGIVLLSATLLITVPASPIHAQEGTLVRAAAKEAVEIFTGQAERQGAKAVATELTEFGGGRVIHGCNGLVDGTLAAPGMQERALDRARKAGFTFGGEEQNR